MKKMLLFMSAALIAGTLQAQTTIKPTVGLNFTDWSKDDLTGEYKAKAGWQIGGSVAFGKKFYVEPGIFYVGKSTEFITSGSNPDEFSANLNGIRIPVAVGLNLLGNEKTAFSLRGFGGFSGFFVTGVSDDLQPVEDEIAKSQWGVFAGAGIDIWKIFLDVSYEWSLTDISKDVQSIDVGKTRSIFINAGIRINL
jgi:hypothetical protein